jgi:hypothetical protein
MADSSSIDADVSSREAACCTAPDDSVCALVAISAAALATTSAVSLIDEADCPTRAATQRETAQARRAATITPKSPWPPGAEQVPRSCRLGASPAMRAATMSSLFVLVI